MFPFVRSRSNAAVSHSADFERGPREKGIAGNAEANGAAGQHLNDSDSTVLGFVIGGEARTKPTERIPNFSTTSVPYFGTFVKH